MNRGAVQTTGGQANNRLEKARDPEPDHQPQPDRQQRTSNDAPFRKKRPIAADGMVGTGRQQSPIGLCREKRHVQAKGAHARSAPGMLHPRALGDAAPHLVDAAILHGKDKFRIEPLQLRLLQFWRGQSQHQERGNGEPQKRKHDAPRKAAQRADAHAVDGGIDSRQKSGHKKDDHLGRRREEEEAGSVSRHGQHVRQTCSRPLSPFGLHAANDRQDQEEAECRSNEWRLNDASDRSLRQRREIAQAIATRRNKPPKPRADDNRKTAKKPGVHPYRMTHAQHKHPQPHGGDHRQKSRLSGRRGQGGRRSLLDKPSRLLGVIA